MGSEGMMASSGFALMAAASRAWLWKCQSEPGKQTPTQENRSPACAASLGTDYPQRVPKPPGNDELDPASLAKARLGAWLLSLQRTSRSAVDGWPDPGERGIRSGATPAGHEPPVAERHGAVAGEVV
jgi:hypothetical protein